jgi:hypothetical protein
MAGERRKVRRAQEDEEEDRPRRRRSRDAESAATPISPMVYGILSILFCWTGPVGLALSGLALNKAAAALDELPGGRRGDNARKNLGIAKTLGMIGTVLSGIMLIIAIILWVRSPRQ